MSPLSPMALLLMVVLPAPPVASSTIRLIHEGGHACQLSTAIGESGGTVINTTCPLEQVLELEAENAALRAELARLNASTQQASNSSDAQLSEALSELSDVKAELAVLKSHPRSTGQCHVKDTSTNGYVTTEAGWYDLQGCGRCYEYCAWHGNCVGGGNPATVGTTYTCDNTVDGLQQQWTNTWRCLHADGAAPYMPDWTALDAQGAGAWTWSKCAAGHGGFATNFAYRAPERTEIAWLLNHPKLTGKCFEPPSQDTSYGYATSERGWYDLQGCGRCYELCAWHGNCGGGGDPKTTGTVVTCGAHSGAWRCRSSDEAQAYLPDFSALDAQGTDAWKWDKCSGYGALV